MISQRKKLGGFIILTFFLLFFSQNALAGFGISPPFFRNDNLTRGSYFEEKIYLVRGDPVEDSKVTIMINVPGADSWIKIDKGTSFILPKGEKAVPILVSVQVPNDAPYGRYTGFMRITVEPKEVPPGQVGIALGARVEVDLNVAERKIFNFIVRLVDFLDSEEGYKWLFFFIPGKLTMRMTIENTGNLPVAPTKVHLDVYDMLKSKILESLNSAKIEGKVLPFKTDTVLAIFKTKLPKGSYWAKYKIYKDNDVVREGELVINIKERGSIPGYKGFNLFSAMIFGNEKTIVSLLLAVIIVAISIPLYKIIKKILVKRKRKK
jgi:hypothetical protein